MRQMALKVERQFYPVRQPGDADIKRQTKSEPVVESWFYQVLTYLLYSNPGLITLRLSRKLKTPDDHRIAGGLTFRTNFTATKAPC